MKEKNTIQMKLKIMTAVCIVLLGACLHIKPCRASVLEVAESRKLNHSIHDYDTDDNWYDDPDEDWNNDNKQMDEDEKLTHEPFITEVPEGYTPIRSIDDLYGINNNPSGKYILMNDIDMTEETSPDGSWDTGHGWTPLDAFSGVFDGNGYRIIGMHIYGGSDVSYDAGLFSELMEGSFVQNLGLVDCDIDLRVAGAYYKIGGIAGTAERRGNGRGSIIRNCYTDGTIQVRSSVGYAQVLYIGGIVGAGGVISDCYNMAEISSDAGGYNYKIGGIGAAADIEACYNAGKINVSSYNTDMGAIVGSRYYSSVSNNYYLNTTAVVSDDTYADDSDQGGKALTDAQMKRANSFKGFNFHDQSSGGAWMVDALSAYPYPQLSSCPQVRVKNLEITSGPDRVSYYQGDELDLSGAVLLVAYEDGVVTSTKINKDMVYGVDMDKPGRQTAIVRYLNANCSFDINVEEMKASGITLSHKKCSLERNKKVQLNAEITPSNVTDKSVQWTSDNEVVATVTDKGVVRGINAGTAKITATTGNGLSASCVVTVTIPAKSITLNKTSLILKKGKSRKLKATLNPLGSTDTVKWTSSDPLIVSVNKNGVAKAKRQGYATIMASVSSGKRAYVKIIVR